MEAFKSRIADEQTWKVISAVQEIARQRDSSAAAVSLAWLAARPAVTSVILGARNAQQLDHNLKAATLRLTAKDTAELSEVSAPVAPDYPYGKSGADQRHRKIEGGRYRLDRADLIVRYIHVH